MSRIPNLRETRESNIVIESAQRLAICYVKGHLLPTTTEKLISHIADHEADIDTIILDLTELITMSSSGVGGLCKLSLDMLKSIIVVCPQDNEVIRNFITEIGLDKVVVMKDSLSSALSLIAAKLEVERSKVSV